MGVELVLTFTDKMCNRHCRKIHACEISVSLYRKRATTSFLRYGLC